MWICGCCTTSGFHGAKRGTLDRAEDCGVANRVNFGASTAAGAVTGAAVCLEQPLLNKTGNAALVIKSGLPFR